MISSVRGFLIGVLLGFGFGPRALGGSASPSQSSQTPVPGDSVASSEPTAPGESGASGESLETIVTSTRTPRPVRDVPTSVTVVPRAEIVQSPTQTLDELLRTLPSFATFRRSNSLAADPTAQGVNLRGIGPSGVSRSLVLVDGLPGNDGFGGWFYWRQFPRIGIERIEVAPGGGSALYGNYALGGVIQLFSRPVLGPELDVDASGGYPKQFQGAARAADRFGPLSGVLEGEAFSTSGYFVVAPSERGPIDQEAPSDHATGLASLAYEVSRSVRLWARGGYFWEQQNAGTPLSGSTVRSGSYSAGAVITSSSFGTLDFTFFGHVQDFKQDRSRINAARSMEAPSARQDVPSDDQGLSLVWTSNDLSWGGRHQLLSGVELRRIHGISSEELFPAPSTQGLIRRETGGKQEFLGVFAQDAYDVSSALELVAALRFDAWRNFDASQTTEDTMHVTTKTAFADRSDNQLSPKLAARYHVVDGFTLRAAGYSAFRAPTLNELYRPFQVGTILTAANDQLGPETLHGVEAGFELIPQAGLLIRTNGFWNVLDQPITNVTLSAPLPDGSQRRRENLGQARIRGIELDAGWHFARAWTAAFSYTLVDSRVTSAPGVPDLVGKRLAQDPVHRVSGSLTFDFPSILTATVEGRFIGPQFEDDLNQLPMPGFFIVGLSASRRIVSPLEAYAAIENLFNRQYLVGRAGIDTIGQPFTVRFGLRLHLGS